MESKTTTLVSHVFFQEEERGMNCVVIFESIYDKLKFFTCKITGTF